MKLPLTLILAAALGATGCSTGTHTKSDGTLTPTWTATPSQSSYYINSVAVSADASRVIGGTFSHSYSEGAGTGAGSTGTFGTYCYGNSGQLLWKDEFAAWQGVYWVDVSADAQWAAAGGWMSESPLAGFVRAYDASTGKPVLNYSTTARVNQVALSADGTTLVSAANTLVLFSRQNGSYSKSDEFQPATADTMETIALSADGTRLVAAAYSGEILLFQINDGKLGTPTAWKLPGGGYSHCVKMTPDGSAFAAGGSNGAFYLFDVASFIASPAPTVTYVVPNAGSIYGVAIANDASAFVGIANVSGGGGEVYYVGRQGTIGNLKWSFRTQHNPNSASLNVATGQLAVADGHPDGTPGAYYLLDTATGAVKGTFATSNMSWPIVLAGNGNAMVGGSDNSNIYYFALPKPALAAGRQTHSALY